MIRLPGIRDKGAGPQLGARQPGKCGPFGVRPDEDGDGLDDEPDGQDHDSAQDLDQPEPRLHMAQDS